MDNRTKTIYLQEFRLKFPEGYPDQLTSEEGLRVQQPKCCHNKEDITPNVNKKMADYYVA